MNAHKIIRIVLLGALLCTAKPLQAQSSDKEPPHPTYHLCGAGHIGCDVHPEPDNVVDYPLDERSSGLKRIYLVDSKSYNFDLTVKPFKPGVDKKATWILIARDNGKSAKAVIVFEDMAGNDTTITINYGYPPSILRVSSQNIDFGNVALGDTAYKDITIINDSDNQKYLIYNISLYSSFWGNYGSMAFAIFEEGLNRIELPRFINPIDTLKLIVRFCPSETGVFSDSVIVLDTNQELIRFRMTGRGVAPIITVTDTVLKTRPGKPVAGEFVIRNKGNYQLRITHAKGISNSVFDFSYYQDLNPSPKNPIIIGTAPFNSKPFYFVFNPPKPGIYRDTVAFTSNTTHNWNMDEDFNMYDEADSIAYITGICEGPDNADEEAEQRFECYLQNNSELIITTDLPADEPFNIEIYSYLGTKVLQCERKERIDISALPEGLYFVRCGAKFSKFVKI